MPTRDCILITARGIARSDKMLWSSAPVMTYSELLCALSSRNIFLVISVRWILMTMLVLVFPAGIIFNKNIGRLIRYFAASKVVPLGDNRWVL